MYFLGIYESPTGNLILDLTPFLPDASVTTNEHGPERLSVPVPTSLADALRIYDQPGLLYVRLSYGARALWEGRLEDPALSIARGGALIRIHALGYWRAFSDGKYTALWSATGVAEFVETIGTMVATYDESERWQRDTNNRIFIALVKNNAYTLNKAGGLGMSIPHQSSRQIVGIQFELTANLSGNFTFRCNTTGGDISIGSLSAGVIATSFTGTGAAATRAYHLVLGTPKDTVIFDVLAAAAVTYAGETAAAYAQVTKLRIVTSTANRVDTTLTAARAAGAGVTATVGSTARMYAGMQLVINSGNNPSEVVTVTSVTSATQFVATFVSSYAIGDTVQGFVIYASEIVKDLLSTINALNSQLNDTIALIQSPGADLPDEIYEDADMAAIAVRLAALGDDQIPPRLWEVGVDIDRLVYFRPRGFAGRTWYVDADELEVERSLEDVQNRAYAVYEDANGRTLRTTAAVDAASVSRYGISRQAAVSAQTTSAVTAGVIRDTFLQDQKDSLPRASIPFDAVYDASGARWPLAAVRSGDTIVARNLPPLLLLSTIDRVRSFLITHTDYNFGDDTIAVEPEQPIPTLETMLARRAAGIA